MLEKMTGVTHSFVRCRKTYGIKNDINIIWNLEKLEEKEEEAPKGKCASLFDVKNVADSFKSVFKKRENNMRA